MATVALVACGRLNFDPAADADAQVGPGPFGNRAFVTSSVQPAGSLGGLAGADAVCAARAREAGLAGRFVAWVSTPTVAAMARLDGARGWYRTDGEPVADTAMDLANGDMVMPLRVDEHGADLPMDPTFVTTGSYGGRAQQHCSEYTDLLGLANAGQPYYAGGGWENRSSIACSELTRLYCFQVDHDLPLVRTPATGRTAFVSRAEFVPTSGRAAADSICSTEAQGAGLPGTYAAMLPGVAPAAEGFDATGTTWIRRDGVALARTTADVLAARFLAPLSMTADGAREDVYVVTGGYAPTAPIDPARNCDAWTNPGGGSFLGWSGATGMIAFAETSADCGTTARVYCFEQ